VDELELIKLYLKTPYFQFAARKNSDFDQMTSFIEDYFEGGKIVLGGTGSSKTYTASFLLSKMIFNHKAPGPNTPIWIGSQTQNLVGNIWLQALSKFITEQHILNIRWRKTLLHPEIVMLKPDEEGNSFNLHFFSYEQGRKALQAANVWMVWLDEQCSGEIIEEVWGRLRTWRHNNMLIYSLTPLEPDPYLQDIYDRRDEAEIRDIWKFYHLDTMKNQHISEEWKRTYLDSLPPDIRLTRQFGEFASYRGAIYPEFINELCNPPKKIEELTGEKFIGIDFGFHNPAAQWVIKEKDTYYVVNDMQCHDIMPDKFAEMIKMKCYDHTWKVIVDYEDAISIRYLNQVGITTTAARKNVLDGINNLKSLMFVKKFYVFPHCKDTIRQLKQYQWKDFAEGKEEKDEVKKVNDHLCDTIRYITYTTLKSVVKPWESNVSNNIKLVQPMKNPLLPQSFHKMRRN
jgi:phage terminase large subunit